MAASDESRHSRSRQCNESKRADGPLTEGLFSKLENWRRVATRYDRTKESYLGFFTLASIKLWLPFANDA